MNAEMPLNREAVKRNVDHIKDAKNDVLTVFNQTYLLGGIRPMLFLSSRKSEFRNVFHA